MTIFKPHPWDAYARRLVYSTGELVLTGDVVDLPVEWNALGKVVGFRGDKVLVRTEANATRAFEPASLLFLRRRDGTEWDVAVNRQRAAGRALDEGEDHP